jgi:hypothetical protein
MSLLSRLGEATMLQTGIGDHGQQGVATEALPGQDRPAQWPRDE